MTVTAFEALRPRTAGPALLGLGRNVAERWRQAPPGTRTRAQMATLILVTVLAYNYSLTTLFQSAGLETPLAYASLVPAIALALAAVRRHPRRPEPAIHDRQVDYIVGLPLVLAAVGANLLLPARWSAMYWVMRFDLFTLPVFVAGAVAIIFGVRVLWRQKLAVGYLFLAWPYPYQTVLLKVLNGFTAVTLAAVKEMVKLVPVAKTVTSADNTLFVITHAGHQFPLSVVSACSGVNSVVGFLLIGSAFAAIVKGPLVRKLAWLVGGMAVVWALNLARILLIFWSGKTWGEHVALDVLHPFVGLVLFGVGVLVMVLAIKPVGLHIEFRGAAGGPVQGPAAGVAPAAPARAPSPRPRGALAVPKLYAAVAVVVASAVVLGFSNLGLKAFNLVADTSGVPRLTPFITAPVGPPGWVPVFNRELDQAKPLFGDTSVWNRYSYKPTPVPAGDLRAPTASVVGDVIVTPDLQAFSAYGVEACYEFHGYNLKDVAQVDVGAGITGQSLSYTGPGVGSWTIVYWITPVKWAGKVLYEREVLFIKDTGTGVVVPATAGNADIRDLAGSLDGKDPAEAQLVENRDFLVAFARETIALQSHRAAQHAAHPGPSAGVS